MLHFVCSTFAVVENSLKSMENFGIDTDSIGRATMRLHVKNITRKEQYGRDSFMASEAC